VSMNRILADDVSNIGADIYLMTHTTNPLLGSSTISDALELFQKSRACNSIDSLFSVNCIQSRFYSAACRPINHDPKNLIRTQDLEPWYEENSNLYLFTRDSFMTTQARIGKRPMMFETPKYESIDIDTIDDWDFAVAAGRYMLEREE
ncbi:MAG: acylneuraminate cytidylyltransferase family protein, partial [Gammaproteobacteria bacterium]